ncbi:MAG: RNA methyltransferase [Pseudomonadota bacterium]
MGAIIRTAAWFDATVVLLGEGCADLLNPKTVRATMGALFHLPVCRNVILPDTLDKLKERGFAIAVAAADGSPDWRSWSDAPRSALLLGSEAHGVAQQLREHAGSILAIPRQGAGESLNVAVTAGVFLSATLHSSAKS